MGFFDFIRRKPEPQLMLPQLSFHPYPTDAKEDEDTDPPLQPPVGTIRHLKSPGLLYRTQEGFTRGVFRSPEYNLYDIGRLEDLDGYVARAFSKKIGLMFKEGYEITGHNKRYVRYVRRRLKQISDASDLSTNQLLRQIGSALIKKSNAFIVKVRKTESSGGNERTLPGSARRLKPIAGLFTLPSETMRVDVDQNGKIYRWRQEMDHDRKEFSPEDITHFYFDRKDGFVFGTPTVLPVIDDVLALRKIEENVEVLIHQFLFPLYQYKVGTEDKPATSMSDGTDEIAYVEQKIALMPTEGGIVTPERHEIKVIGGEGSALRAEQYLIYFKQRVFSGLGISSVDMGEAGCHDEKTETLTENGWKYHYDIDHRTERIATYNPETKRIEFHLANSKFEDRHIGEMIHFSGKHLDLSVTPHHEMWVKSRYGGNWQKQYAADLADGKFAKEFYMLDSASFAEELSPVAPVLIKATDKRQSDIKIDHADWAEFLGWFISEGCLDSYNAKEKRYRILISQNRGTKLDSITQLLDRIGIRYSVTFPNVGGKEHRGTIRINSKNLFNLLDRLVGRGAENKKIPDDFLSWPVDSRRQLYYSLMAGDGSFGGTTKGDSYNTISKVLADQVQLLAVSLGYSAKVKFIHNRKNSHGDSIYRVFISNTTNQRLVSVKTMIRRICSNEIVYCYNVPNHLFLTRRGGKISIQGNSSNRATASEMSRSIIDGVKDFQRVFEDLFNEHIIRELMLESTFDKASLFDEENLVKLQFKEIDLENQIKRENHAADLFAKQAITYDELRERVGQESIEIPSRQDIKEMDSLELDQQFPQFYRLHWKLFGEPLALIQAKKEPWDSASQAAAANPSLDMNEEQRVVEEQGKKKEIEQEAKIKRQGQGAKRVSGQTKNRKISDNSLHEKYEDLRVYAGTNNTRDWLKLVSHTHFAEMKKDLLNMTRRAFINGYASVLDDSEMMGRASASRHAVLDSRATHYVEKLRSNLINALDRHHVDELSPTDRIAVVDSIFNSLRYRIDFIWDVESGKARTLGYLMANADLGVKRFKMIPDTDSCEKCINHSTRIHSMAELAIDDLAPRHAGCKCGIELLED